MSGNDSKQTAKKVLLTATATTTITTIQTAAGRKLEKYQKIKG